METIGVRELRQNASRYLARVAAGDTVQITDRGRPVAMLVPPPRDRWAELLAAGRVRPPEHPGDVLDVVPVAGAVSASDELAALREHER